MRNLKDITDLKWNHMIPIYGLVEYFIKNKKEKSLFEAIDPLINFSLICTYNCVILDYAGRLLESLFN